MSEKLKISSAKINPYGKLTINFNQDIYRLPVNMTNDEYGNKKDALELSEVIDLYIEE